MGEEPFLEFVGIFDNNGNRYEPDSIPKPPLCLLCRQDDTRQPFEHLLCTLVRLEHMLQEDTAEFVCHAFRAPVRHGPVC